MGDNQHLFFKGVFTYLYQRYHSETEFLYNKKYNPVKISPGWQVHSSYWEKMLKGFYILPELDLINLEESIKFDRNKLIKVTYDELKSKDLVILRLSKEKKYYTITRKQSTTPSEILSMKPSGTEIIYDPINERYKLTGRKTGKFNAGVWFNLKSSTKHSQHNQKKDFRDYLGETSSGLENYYKDLDAKRFTKIVDLPVMWSNKGEIVCIKRDGDTKTIGIVGKKGQGKSFLKNRICGLLKRHDYWRTEIAILNDCLNEDSVMGMSPYYHYSNYFNRMFPSDKFLTETLSALPVIEFHPHFNEVTKIQSRGVNDLYISLPYKELIEDFTRYFDLNKSAKYLYKIMDQLKECQSYDEIKGVVESLDLGKNSEAVHSAIMANIDKLWEQKLLDLSSSVPSKWWVLKNKKMVGEFNPVTATIAAGMIPILNTSEIVNKEWFDEYFRYFLNDLFETQKKHPYFRANKIETYAVVDELKNIVTKGKGEKTARGIMMIRAVTEGRPVRLGTIWINQNYSTVPEPITTNTNYLFTFLNMEANLITKNYSLPKSYAARIKKLKRFEVCGVTDSKWVIYDSDGNRRETDEPVFGYALPPLNIHKKPMVS